MRHLRLSLRTLSETGDSIIEVLVAMSVISMVLGGAYVTTNSNLRSSRDAEERGSAVKLVESQLEQLKDLAARDPGAIFNTTTISPFCVYQDDIHTASESECTVSRAGNPSNAEPVYSLSAVRNGETFTVKANWTKTGGNGTNNVQVVYRLHE